jgi:hypothetical protein
VLGGDIMEVAPILGPVPATTVNLAARYFIETLKAQGQALPPKTK